MKKILFLLTATIGLSAMSQAQPKIPEMDKSPMDMSYFPANYPVLKLQGKAPANLVARIIYGRPQRDNRQIFGKLLEYGKVWRLGANESTELEFFRNVKIDGKPIKKGRYTLYAIPDSSTWTFILSKSIDTWGAFDYNAANDVLRVSVPVEKQTESVEDFSLFFDKTAAGCMLIAEWEYVKAALPISL